MTAIIRNKITVQLFAVLMMVIATLLLWVLIDNTLESGFIISAQNNYINISHDPNFSKYDNFLISTEKSDAFNSISDNIGINVNY